MKRTMAFILLFSLILVFGQKVEKNYGESTPYHTNFMPSVSGFADTSLAPKYLHAWTSTADSVKTGFVVVWDSTTTIACSLTTTGAVDTLALIDTTTTNRWWQIRSETASTVSSMLVIVEGLDSAGVAKTDTVTLNGAGDKEYHTGYWTKVSLAYTAAAAAADVIYVNKVPFMTVTTTTGANNTQAAGVVMKTILNDSLGRLVVFGMTKAYLKGATTACVPGTSFGTTSTAGYGVTGGVTAGAIIGTMLQGGSTDAKYWVLVGRE